MAIVSVCYLSESIYYKHKNRNEFNDVFHKIMPKPLFLLTVDTEEEWDWNGAFPQPPFSTENIKAVPELQAFCAAQGVMPTYFIDYAVIDEEENVAIFKTYLEKGELDFGAHLHPWTTPPVREEICNHHSHAINLDISLFGEKMHNLTRVLQEKLGKHPFSFRSGRWGLSGKMLKVLSDLGYRVDSSVRPFYDDLPHFSYQQAMTHPYWPSYDDLLLEGGQRDILEIPASSGFNFANFEQLNRLHGTLSQPPLNKLRAIGILWKLGLMRKVTVTPENTDASDVKRCIDMAVKRGDVIINLFFHSSNLVPGNTDYVQSEKDLKTFYGNLAQIIDHARQRHGADFVSMRQAYERLTGDGLTGNQSHENYWDLTA